MPDTGRGSRAGSLRVVVIVGSWPPTLNARSIQNQRLLSQLPWQTTVVAPRHEALPAGPLLGEDVGRGSLLRLHRAPPSWNPDRWLAGLSRRGWLVTMPADRWSVLAAPLALHCARLPDRPDLLVTIHWPPASHIAGLILHRSVYRSVPWIAMSFDQWAALRPPSRSDADQGESVVQRLKAWLERRVFRSVDGATFHCPELAEHFRARVPELTAIPTELVTQAFDPAAYPRAQRRDPGETCLLRHVGTLYADWRTPLPLLEGMERLRERAPGIAAALRVELVGHWVKPSRLREEVRKRLTPLGGRLLPPVPASEALRLMCEADALVHFAASEPAFDQPSKLVDYMGSGRPILALCRPGSREWQLTANAGGLSADLRDPAAVATALETVLRRHRDGSLASPRNAFIEAFSVENVARRLDDFAQRIVHEHRRGRRL